MSKFAYRFTQDDEADFLDWVGTTKGQINELTLESPPVIVHYAYKQITYGHKIVKVTYSHAATSFQDLFYYAELQYNKLPPSEVGNHVHLFKSVGQYGDGAMLYIGKMCEVPEFDDWADRHPRFALVQTNKYLKELMLGNQQLHKELDTIKQQMVLLTDAMANSMRLELDYVKKSAQEREELMKTWPGQAGSSK